MSEKQKAAATLGWLAMVAGAFLGVGTLYYSVASLSVGSAAFTAIVLFTVASSRPLWWCQACGCGADRGQRASRSLGEPRQVQDGRRQMSSVGWRWSVTRRAARLVDLQRRYSPQTERTRRHRPAARPCHRGHPRGCQHAVSATPQPVAVVPRRVRSVPRPLRAGAAGGVPNLQLDVLRIVEPQPCAGGQIRSL